jgi:hypothetical protein
MNCKHLSSHPKIMQVFKTDKNKYLTSELKSWLGAMVFGIIFYFVFKFIFSVSQNIIFVGLVVLVLLKLSNMLTQYHTSEIRINPSANQLTILLSSIMLGSKENNYSLRDSKSQVTNKSKFGFLVKSGLTLEIYLPNDKAFKINDRYGFSEGTLEAIDNSIKKGL